MTGKIYHGTYTNGIFLSNPAAQLPATITGYVAKHDGAAVRGTDAAAWTIFNRGTVASTGSIGAAVSFAAGGEVHNTIGTISGRAGVVIAGAAGTATNLGTIAATGTNGNAVWLLAGGAVVNGSAGATSATLSAPDRQAVVIAGNPGTVTNHGTITTGGTRGAVVLRDGGAVTNDATGRIESTGGTGVSLDAGGTVGNQGTIAGRRGVYLADGGRVVNGAAGATGALISASGRQGVLIAGAPGTVANYGTLATSGAGYSAVVLSDAGSLTNGSTGSTAALISAASSFGVRIAGASGTISNFGTIKGTSGIDLADGGRVTNGSIAATSSLISAVTGAAVKMDAGLGTVVNFGTILSGGPTAVRLNDGGVVTNGADGSTAATIAGLFHAVYITGSAGAVTNFGTIGETFQPTILFNRTISAIRLNDGGSVTNFGTIQARPGGAGIYINGSNGTVINGSANATAALIRGDIYAFRGTVTNFGMIVGSAIFLTDGVLRNGSPASSTALIDIGSLNSPASIANYGTINCSAVINGAGSATNGSNTSTMSLIQADRILIENIVNFGTIKANDVICDRLHNYNIVHGPLDMYATGGIVANFGEIINDSGGAHRSGAGVLLENITSYTTITNHGLIEGSTMGIISLPSNYHIFANNNVVVNYGTIGNSAGADGVAVQLGAGASNKLVVEAGSVFVGKVLGGGSSEIDFAEAGAADMSNVSGFKTIGLGDGQDHSLTLADANFAGVTGGIITVDDGDSGNTVDASSLSPANAIVVDAGAGLDTLTGGAGNDLFYAGGDSVMTGGAGSNEFVFSAPGANTIADLAASAMNLIVFSNSGFNLGESTPSSTPQSLPAVQFTADSTGAFTATSQRFAYDTTNGELFYSASGTTASEHLVVTLSGAPTLNASNLFYIT